MAEHTAEKGARRSLRESLIAEGFKREAYTDDLPGVGDYTETWARGQDKVAVAWGPRTRVTPSAVTEEPTDD